MWNADFTGAVTNGNLLGPWLLKLETTEQQNKAIAIKCRASCVIFRIKKTSVGQVARHAKLDRKINRDQLRQAYLNVFPVFPC